MCAHSCSSAHILLGHIIAVNKGHASSTSTACIHRGCHTAMHPQKQPCCSHAAMHPRRPPHCHAPTEANTLSSILRCSHAAMHPQRPPHCHAPTEAITLSCILRCSHAAAMLPCTHVGHHTATHPQKRTLCHAFSDAATLQPCCHAST